MSYPSLKITFLGTGTSSGVPMIGCDCEVCTSSNPKDKRLRSSILVQSSTTTIVVDSGPDFRQQMLRHDVKKLDAVVFTHSHKDHIAGLDDVRAYNYFQQSPMNIYATEFTLGRIRTEFDYAFTGFKYPGAPSITTHVIDTKSFLVGDVLIEPIPAWHLKMPVLGFRFGDFAYLTDLNRIEEPSKQKIKGSKVLVLNALRHEKHISHFTLQEAIDLADELAIPTTYFTHLSHQMGLYGLIEAQLPRGRHLSYDGLEIYV